MLASRTQGNCTSEASTSTFQENLSGETHEQIRRYSFWRRS